MFKNQIFFQYLILIFFFEREFNLDLYNPKKTQLFWEFISYT